MNYFGQSKLGLAAGQSQSIIIGRLHYRLQRDTANHNWPPEAPDYRETQQQQPNISGQRAPATTPLTNYKNYCIIWLDPETIFTDL